MFSEECLEVLMNKWVVALAVAPLLATAAPAASAAPLERENYSFTDSFTVDCGFPIHNEVTGKGTFILKAPRTPGGPPYLMDNYEVHETLTANGRTLFVDHQGLYKDLHITLVEGTVYQFVSMESGRPFVVTDPEGNVLFRDRGLLVTTFQIDTQGDTDLGNDVFIDGSFELLADHGRHPGFYIDACAELEAYFLG